MSCGRAVVAGKYRLFSKPGANPRGYVNGSTKGAFRVGGWGKAVDNFSELTIVDIFGIIYF